MVTRFRLQVPFAGVSGPQVLREGGGLVTAAYERLVDALRDVGSTVIANGTKAQAQCPAHEDRQASLSLGPRKDGKGVVLYCHASCDYRDVLAALKFSPRDLFDDDGMRAAYSDRNTYTYPDGRTVHRAPGKKFRQSGNTKGVSLFHADKIGYADTVYVPEGEKDVLAAESVGAAAVCPAMGVGKAHKFDWSALAGKHVIIVADRDEPGRKHATEVATLLRRGRPRCDHGGRDGKDAADHIAAGHNLDELVDVKTVKEPVDGAALFGDVERFAGRFLAFPRCTTWWSSCCGSSHTWAVSAFYVTPRLVLDSPEPGSGKTRVLEVLALLCPNAKLTISTTTAALYRRIAKASIDDPAAINGGELFHVELLPTILQDEADAVFGRTNNPQAEDLRALYNSGYRRGATVDRCEGDAKNMQVREFPVFAPVALAGLAGKMPQTILDRAVVMHMRRRAPDEHVDEFRERDARVDASPCGKSCLTGPGRCEGSAKHASSDARRCARPAG